MIYGNRIDTKKAEGISPRTLRNDKLPMSGMYRSKNIKEIMDILTKMIRIYWVLKIKNNINILFQKLYYANFRLFN